MPKTSFGAFIVSVRKDRKISQKQMAIAIGISNRYLCDLEKGNREPPRRNTEFLSRIANYLNIPLGTLFDKVGINIDLSQEKNRKFMKIMRSRSKAAFLISAIEGLREDLSAIESASRELPPIRKNAQKALLRLKELETNIMHAA